MVSRPLRALAIGAALLAVPLALAAPGCGSDAVGVADCRQIEYVRCELAPTCAPFLQANGNPSGFPIVTTADDVARCKEFYRDQCLNGIENADGGTAADRDSACIDALRATAACAASPSIQACKGGPAVVDPDVGVAPCKILLSTPEVLAACNWIASPPAPGTSAATTTTTTVTTTATTTTGAGGAGGAGGGSGK